MLLLAAPLLVFAAAFVAAGGRSPVPLALAAVGLVVVLGTVSVVARWSVRQESKEGRRR